MATLRRDIHIERAPEDVWTLVGDPARLHEWFPVQDCRVEGNKRWVTLPTGIVFEEDIVVVDGRTRRFQYSIVNNLLIRDHFGTVDVMDDGHGHTVLSYSTQCTPNVFALVTAGASGQALRNAKRILEAAHDGTNKATN